VSTQRRTALASVVAAAVLIALKLASGLASGSLGLVSEALHSGTDLVAALLTLYAVGYAARPADVGHPYGHGKAEHLAALAEAGFLALVSIAVAALAVARLTGGVEQQVEPPSWIFAVLALVIAIDVSRTVVSYRAARRFASAAFFSSALHFGSDLVGTVAVLVGLLLASAGWPAGDSFAAVFVAVLVLLAAARLMRRNVDVLMDRAPAAAQEAARSAIDALEPPVDLRRLRLRQAGGRHFVDAVIGISPGAVVGQGHAAADAVEAAIERALPGSDVVVHVEPLADSVAVGERALAAALAVPQVREVHNVSVLQVDGRTELSLHLRLPGALPLEEAHGVATAVERAIAAAIPEIDAVQTHLEPLAPEGAGSRPGDVRADEALVHRIVREATGHPPRELRFLHTDQGLVAFVTLELAPDTPLAEAHGLASKVEAGIRRERVGVAEVIVHTEP